MYEVYKSVMDDNSNYEFDVYTAINRFRAAGITHGYISKDNQFGADGKSYQKKVRQSRFPLDRILQSITVDVKKAEASVESDRQFILNTITGRAVDDVVLDDDTNYDQLNDILRGVFVTPVLDRIIKYIDFQTITRCLAILKES